MAKTDYSSKNKPEKSTLNELLKNGNSKRNEVPAEEFISPDPTRSAPEKKGEPEKLDKMGISEKAKNQSSDESDVAKGKK